MQQRRWIDQSQPQTLVFACVLLYIGAVFTALFGGLFTSFGLLLIAGAVAAGYGIANERKWGYGLAIGVALLPFVFRLAFADDVGEALTVDLAGLMFDIALVALLLHPQSREYQRIWFK